jgi:hypothetical protein
MAGKRQHILPRFLLKGFSSRVEGEKVFASVHGKSNPAFETTIENISVEKHFYGKTDEVSADDEITDLEPSFAYLIDSLRQEKHGFCISDPLISDFIAHLSIRTKQIRESFRESTEYLVERLLEYLSDFENSKKLILNNPKMAKQEVTKLLMNIPVPDWQKGMVLELMDIWLPTLVDEHKEEFAAMIQNLFEEIKPILPRAVKEGHIKSLARNPAPSTRADGYRQLNWFIYKADRPVLLGDTGCIFEVTAGRRFKPIDDMADEIVNVFLPITSGLMVVGTRYSSLPRIDEKPFIKAIAKCSYDYFVCSHSSREIETLSNSIGEWSGILSKKEIEQILNECINDIETGALATESVQ